MLKHPKACFIGENISWADTHVANVKFVQLMDGNTIDYCTIPYGNLLRLINHNPYWVQTLLKHMEVPQ